MTGKPVYLSDGELERLTWVLYALAYETVSIYEVETLVWELVGTACGRAEEKRLPPSPPNSHPKLGDFDMWDSLAARGF